MNIKINIAKYIIISFFTLLGLVGFSTISNANAQGDLLQQSYQAAREYDTIINLGNKKESVGNTILRESSTATIDGGVKRETRDPLIVRITKFLLRITIVLAITMVIFNGTKYMIDVAQGKERLGTDAQKNLIRLVVGLIIALSSVSIIYLLSSITYSTIRTSDDNRGKIQDLVLPETTNQGTES